MLPWAIQGRVHNPNSIQICSAIVAQLTAVFSGMSGMLFPLKLPLGIGDLLPWAYRVHNPNDISIGSAVFAQLTSVVGHARACSFS